jgi:hypothetical protein
MSETSSSTTRTEDVHPITVESLWKLYTEEKLIPVIFRPTGETVYVTLQMADWLEAFAKGQPKP